MDLLICLIPLKLPRCYSRHVSQALELIFASCKLGVCRSKGKACTPDEQLPTESRACQDLGDFNALLRYMSHFPEMVY